MNPSNFDLENDCTLVRVGGRNPIIEFDCGDSDLNEFFSVDAPLYRRQLLGETYYFKDKVQGKVVCAFTLSNDSIKTIDLPNSRKRKVRNGIPREKHMKAFPATLIGRIGVANEFMGRGVGSQLMDFVKVTALLEEANRCRFLTVDAYNLPTVLDYYARNGFVFLFSTEEQEKAYFGVEPHQEIRTRFMYFDLLELSEQLFLHSA